MNLSKRCEDALMMWLARGTWHTPHPTDKGLWHDFVNFYAQDHGPYLDNRRLREHMQRRLRELGTPVDDNEALLKILRDRTLSMIEILGFLDHVAQSTAQAI